MPIKLASSIDANQLKVTNLPLPTAGSTDAARKVDLESVYTAAISRANHTGTQLANTISDFNTAVRLNQLDQMAAPTSALNLNAQRLTNVADPTGAQDVSTKNYVDSALAGVASGQILKGAVRAATNVNVNIAAAPATIDGVTPNAGDVFLLMNQTTASQNGPYVWTASGSAMTRATNWNSTSNAVVGSYWVVRAGSNADKFALLANDQFTFGTSTATFVIIGPYSAVAPYEIDLGDGSSTSFTVTHNFATKAVNVVCFRNASPYDEVLVNVQHATTNTVIIAPDYTWAAAEFHCVVSKS